MTRKGGLKTFTLIIALHKMGLLTPSGLYRLVSAISKYGINLMALLGLAGSVHGDKTALAADGENLSYRSLLTQAEQISVYLKEKYSLGSGKRVGFLCRNHAAFIKALFAVSRLGADIYLLNTEMSVDQLNTLLKNFQFDLVVHDHEFTSVLESSGFIKEKLPAADDSFAIGGAYDNEAACGALKMKRYSSGKIMLLSGGTSGNFKKAEHKPSLINYLNPFTAVLDRLKLARYDNVYIATPIYHGYGLAMLFLFFALGKKVFLRIGFNAEASCRLIRENRIEVVLVVPLMINKMLKINPDDLKSLSCIASGGAELSPRLIGEVSNKLGEVLYNLYGTSEAGLNIIATPQDLKASPSSVGRKIPGVRLKILDGAHKEVGAGETGQFCIRNRWSMRNKNSSWIETGDMGFRDGNGYYYLCGRIDDMIVSAGENVYPAEVEHKLLEHLQVEDAVVTGISDDLFGQRLKAFVLPVKGSEITAEELKEWLRTRLARYQMPKEIVITDELPYTSLGKRNRKGVRGTEV